MERPGSRFDPPDVADRRGQARARLRRFLAAGFSLVGIGLLLSIGSRTGRSPDSVPDEPLAHTRPIHLVTEDVQRYSNEHGRLSVEVAAVADGKGTVLGFGAHRLGHRSCADESTPFEIGSVPKAFTGILWTLRIARGELTLDTRIAELLPKGWSLSGPVNQFTPECLTTHNSGLP